MISCVQLPRFASLFAATILLAALVCVPAMAVELPQRGVMAHRGEMTTHPENTLAAFKEAIRLGAHAIEFDVKGTKDQQLVLIHDPTVDRTTNGSGKVSNYTLAEIKQLDAGSWKGPQFAGERVPTLAEALAIMPRDTWLMVHLEAAGSNLAKAAANAVIGAKREHQAIFLAPPAEVTGIKQAERDSGKNLLICNLDTRGTGTNYVDQTIKGGFDALVFSGKGFPLASDIKRLKDNNVRICFYGSDDPDTLTHWFNSGIEFPVVDNLQSSLKVAEKLGIKPWNPAPPIPRPVATKSKKH